MTPILSILVISHNQRELLRRCLDSILAMHIEFPYEIIISDDRSTDGSFELAKQYAMGLENGTLKSNNLLRILALQCNSDECNPAYNSERSGYNRCNAYPYAIGKYIAHVDADDYFLPNAVVYNRQIEALESHPECALAMSNHLYIYDGKPISQAEKVYPKVVPQDGEIVSAHDFIAHDYFHLNQAFIQRRNPNIDPVKLYGKKYVDSIITYHHLQFGPIIYVDACDYVYVQYKQSVTGQMEGQNRDQSIMWCLYLHVPSLIPTWSSDMFREGYASIREVFRMAKANYMLQSQNYKAMHSLNIWIYECFGHSITVYDKIRLKICMIWQRIQKRYGWYGNLGCWIMWKLLK
ncbi:MAG: glycosyltransferase family 2 protein [Paludibacteraceae bacterium]|nr:glycosyltransferase family 2 protein [Paludibacteraceae bacterium]